MTDVRNITDPFELSAHLMGLLLDQNLEGDRKIALLTDLAYCQQGQIEHLKEENARLRKIIETHEQESAVADSLFAP